METASGGDAAIIADQGAPPQAEAALAACGQRRVRYLFPLRRRPSRSALRRVPHISVIIPTLNEIDHVDASVRHAAALGPLDVIVADGGSRDGTQEAAAAAGARVVTSRPGRGPQLNVGALAAQGETLVFLHADTWLAPPARAQLDGALEDARTVCGAFRQRIDASGVVYRALERGNALRAGVCGVPYGDQGIFVRRAAFDSVGGFPDEPLMEDVELMRRLRRIGRPVLLPGPLHVSARRWRERGVARQTARNWMILAAWSCGVSPRRLARWYSPDNCDAGRRR